MTERWQWLTVGVIVLSGLGVWGIYESKFLAGFWGITEDEIAIVTIKREGADSQESLTETITIQDPSKSFWDGLELLGVPLVLAVLGAWFQKSQQEQAERAAIAQQEQAERAAIAQQKQAELVAQRQREQDADETREEALQLYFDRVSALLVDKNLIAIANKEAASPEEKELLEASLDVIRARTLSILRRFGRDIERKSSVICFLAEAEIISKLKLDLNGANLEGANLEGANLEGANLEGANLKGAILRLAVLYEANLYGANLEKAILHGARLSGANLLKVDFTRAMLYRANLEGASLQWANLEAANLERAILRQAVLYEANLEKANLSGAKLEATDLRAISYSDKTIWPAPEEVAKAHNIPEALQRQLGLIPPDAEAAEN